MEFKTLGCIFLCISYKLIDVFVSFTYQSTPGLSHPIPAQPGSPLAISALLYQHFSRVNKSHFWTSDVGYASVIQSAHLYGSSSSRKYLARPMLVDSANISMQPCLSLPK